MIAPAIQEALRALKARGASERELGRLFKISRNSVHRLLTEDRSAEEAETRYTKLFPLIKNLLADCKGNGVRVHEMLTTTHHEPMPYSTLMYLIRKNRLRADPPKRFGIYYFDPGLEMQHDTSPHRVIIDGKTVTAQCASLVLAFSRRTFIQYYPCFTRFEAKSFLSTALQFMQGSAQRCVIDNTSVILAGGAGVHAVIAPEMIIFGRMFGFHFIAHAVLDPNRKGRVERPFHYAENNFLAGRQFHSWEDLNRQARDWCEKVCNPKHKRILGMTSDAAYIQEKPGLMMLPPVLPAIYEPMQRKVDTQGYINVESNRYSVPESHMGRTLEVCKYLDKIEMYYQHTLLATHVRIIGQRDQRSVIKGHHTSLYRAAQRSACSDAEKALCAVDGVVAAYVSELKSHVRGRGYTEMRQLLYFKQVYPLEAFLLAIQQAQRYGLYNMKRLENLILKCVSGEFFNL